MTLRDLVLQTSYRKGRDDIARDFYLPCMIRASRYDRAVGYFRSSVFVLAWPALRDFAAAGGRIRLLCSHVLSPRDADALQVGYSARLDDYLREHFRQEVRSLLAEPILGQPARLLAALVAEEVVDFRIAVLKPGDEQTARGRIFHDKLGIFRDAEHNVVTFKGSMNETWQGLSPDGNIESVDVSASWMGLRDDARVQDDTEYFEQLWSDDYPGVSVREFPEVARRELAEAADPDWRANFPALSRDAQSGPQDDQGRELREHQRRALEDWRESGRRGLVAFATGAGKTFTAVQAIREALSERDEVVLVVVPDEVLFNQWHHELQSTIRSIGVRVLLAGAGHSDWREPLPDWTTPGPMPRLVLATLPTASSEEFLARVVRSENLLLVVDEVHRAGAPARSDLLDIDVFQGPRLGLSATPERAGDREGTARIMQFFERVLEPRYELADAVRDGVLCKYFYHPHVVELTGDEILRWRELTGRIGRALARHRDSDDEIPESVTHLLIERARITKGAENKVSVAVDIMTSHYEAGQRWLVYCDSVQQLEAVRGALNSHGFDALPYHSKMQGSRPEALHWLEVSGGILVGIRCLDEGVDIPTVSHALILASSRNPREFVQRRGRVLRWAERKALAHIHDAIVVAPTDDGFVDPVARGELARAIRFARSAANPSAAARLEVIAIDQQLEIDGVARGGFEDDEAT